MPHRSKATLRNSILAGLLVGLLGPPLLATPGLAAQPVDHANVLLAYAQRRLLPALVDLDESIRSTIQAQSSRPVTFHTEFLDLDGGREARYEEKLLELLRLKYADTKLHGGRIWVTCNLDRGITAHVELPSDPGPEA